MAGILGILYNLLVGRRLPIIFSIGMFILEALYHLEIYHSKYEGLFPVVNFAYILAQRSAAYTAVDTLSQRLLVMDKLKDEFMANTSHEQTARPGHPGYYAAPALRLCRLSKNPGRIFPLRTAGITDDRPKFREFPDHADIQLLFLDIDMPKINGIAAAQAIYTAHHEVDMIFVTAYQNFGRCFCSQRGRLYLKTGLPQTAETGRRQNRPKAPQRC
jgi:CheY-like chemotaxis protein